MPDTGYSTELATFRELLPADQRAQLKRVAKTPPPAALRLNTLKHPNPSILDTWSERYGWQLAPVSYCPAGRKVLSGAESLARTAPFKLGSYYLQEAASMLPAEMLDMTGGELVLDMAAAPGGKTTHLVDLLGDHGLVIANDSSARRMAALRTNILDWGATNIALTQYLGERWGPWFPDTFDQVLLDAPCSGLGLRTAERRKSRPVSESELAALQAQQLRLLESGLRALRPGGQLVYATCSLRPEENEAVLEAILERYPDSLQIQSVDHLIHTPPAPALPGYGPAISRAIRLWPHLYDTVGFFAALLIKTAALGDMSPIDRPRRDLSSRGYRRLGAPESRPVVAQLQDRFGFDLGAVLEAHRLDLYQRRQALFALPERLLERFGDLPVISAGILVAEFKGTDLVPSHELVSRFADRFAQPRLTLVPKEAGRWLKGSEIRRQFESAGVVIVQDEEGQFLGRGKVVPGRLRNLLPARLAY